MPWHSVRPKRLSVFLAVFALLLAALPALLASNADAASSTKMPARAVQARRQRRLLDLQRGGRLAVGQPRRRRRRRSPRRPRRGAPRSPRRARPPRRRTPAPAGRPGRPGRVLLERHGDDAAPGLAQAADVGVAQHAQEVAQVVVAAQHARPREHAGVGLLHEVLRVMAVAAQRPGRAEEPVDVVAELLVG